VVEAWRKAPSRHWKLQNSSIKTARLWTDIWIKFFIDLGIAIAQAVSLWLPIAAVRARARVWSSRICGGKSGAGTGFLRVLQFPLPIFIPSNSPSSQWPGAGTIGQKWPTCRLDTVHSPTYKAAQAVIRRLPNAAAHVQSQFYVMWCFWWTLLSGAGTIRPLGAQPHSTSRAVLVVIASAEAGLVP
jgi:hypothetical protein